MKITTPAIIKNGKLSLRERRTFLAQLSQLPDCEGVLIFQKRQRNRTNNENRYYWGVIVKCWQELIQNEWGESWSAETMHEFLRDHFNYTEYYSEQSGMVFKRTLSTADLTTTDFEAFTERRRRGAYENFGAIIPLPNEDLFLNI